MAMVEVLDGLFEADGDEQTDDDGGNMDEEVAPGVRGVVRRMDVSIGAGSCRVGEPGETGADNGSSSRSDSRTTGELSGV
jgi:hypothetical protein